MRDTPDLTLQPISRLPDETRIEPLPLGGQGPYSIGRSADADWPVPDPTVSRRHAVLASAGGEWLLQDLGSRHGTTINGRALDEGERVPITTGDVLRFGQWTCRVRAGSYRPGLTTPFQDAPAGPESISAVDVSRLSGVAQNGLEALLTLTRELENADSEERIGEAVVGAVSRATKCARVVVARPVSSDELEVLASTTADSPELSRSLIDAAEQRGIVELRVEGHSAEQAHSIMELRIRSAICAPIRLGDTPIAFLVLDTRGSENQLASDATAFCQSVAQLTGMAFERYHAAKLAARHRQLKEDLGAARRAQELLQPPPAGRAGDVSYVYESYAGRVVAGDLFDIFELPEQRAAFFLGDVSGKGVGAAVLMAAAQSQLRSRLLSGAPLHEAVAAVSRDLCARTDSSKFVTLIAGVIDAGAETLELVDAGHGLCALAAPGRPAERLEAPNGFPLGIVEDAAYEAHRQAFPAGSGVVLFSDGAVEQTDTAGEELGFPRVLESIAAARQPADITSALVDAVRRHAGGDFADDLTVAAIQLADAQ